MVGEIPQLTLSARHKFLKRTDALLGLEPSERKFLTAAAKDAPHGRDGLSTRTRVKRVMILPFVLLSGPEHRVIAGA